jgi:hypothetical protein
MYLYYNLFFTGADTNAAFFPDVDGDIAVDIRWSAATRKQHTEARKLQITANLPPIDDADESLPASMRREPRYDAWLAKFEGVPRHMLLCERMWPRCYELVLPRQV